MPMSSQSLQKAGTGMCPAQRRVGFSANAVHHVKPLAAGHVFCVCIQFMTASLSYLWLFIIILVSIKIFILN